MWYYTKIDITFNFTPNFHTKLVARLTLPPNERNMTSHLYLVFQGRKWECWTDEYINKHPQGDWAASHIAHIFSGVMGYFYITDWLRVTYEILVNKMLSNKDSNFVLSFNQHPHYITITPYHENDSYMNISTFLFKRQLECALIFNCITA